MPIQYVEQSTYQNCFLKLKLLLLACSFYSILISPTHVNAQIYISNFTGQLFKTGFSELEGICFDKSGQIYVWEKAGKVFVIDTNGVKFTIPLIDISAEVGNWRDHGLNGFALDPDFLTNGYFYLYYTVDRHHLMNFGTGNYNSLVNEYYNASVARVTRYTANSATNFTTLVSGSRLVLIGENKKTGIAVLHESHSGGQLVFGTDGSLLVSTGDGSSYSYVDSGGGTSYWNQALTDTIIRDKENIGSYRSQLIDCLNGKVLRIDPSTGDGLSSNPYYNSSNPRAAKSRVWDVGLRNPFRMTLRPGTGVTDITAGNPGVLYIGDVGWDNWEDMNVSTGPGLNFGWPHFEGLTPATGYSNVTTVVNKDAPNPLYGTGGCSKQFFKFSDLLVQANLAPSFPNPCNPSQQIPANIPHWVHTRPIIDWSHNGALARTGIYNGNNASEISIGNAQSPVKGFDFIGNASVGGAWYPGTKYPYEFQNSYFHADYAQAWILNLRFHPNNTADSVKFFAANLGPVVDIEYNPNDELLYFIKYPSDIYKIVYTTSVNNPPTAVASQNVVYGAKPLGVNFTGNNSTDPENIPLTYLWNFGDGTATSNSANPSHVFNPVTNNPVAFTVTLTVTDNIGQSDTTKLTVYVNDTPPQVNITSFTDGDLFTMSHNTILPLQANVFDAESSDHNLSYSWQTYLHHNNHEHPESADTSRITTTVITPVGCDGNTYFYRIELTVTDPIGLSTTVQGSVYPSCNPPVANFSANVTSGCAGQQVSFTDATTKFPDSWLWSFPGGNPSSSVLQNPVVTYPSSGTYNVSLTATNTRGSNTKTKTGYIVIYSKPQATISPSGTDSVCSLQSVLLSANTGNNLTYQWLRAGVNIAGATNATHNAVNGGTYKVKVTRSTTGCNTLSAAKKIVYRVVPSVATPQGPTTFCAGDSVKISANPGPYLYHWKKNSNYVSGATSINYTAKTAAVYKVKVTDAFGCTKISNSVTVTVNCKEAESEGVNEFDAVLTPNPLHGQGIIHITLPSNENINIAVFDALGRSVMLPSASTELTKGYNEIHFNTSSFVPGIYFIKVSGSTVSKTLKMVVDKGN